MTEDYIPDRTPDRYTLLGINEYTLFRDGTEIIASWRGDHEELTDFEVHP